MVIRCDYHNRDRQLFIFFNHYLIARHYLKETGMHSRNIKFFKKHIYDAPVIWLCIKSGAGIQWLKSKGMTLFDRKTVTLWERGQLSNRLSHKTYGVKL